MDFSLPGPLSMGFSMEREWRWLGGLGCHALLQRIFPTLGSEPRSPTLQVDSLTSESPWKPMNTGVGSLSLPQGIFLIQDSTQSLLHCRWILYQLRYQGSPQLIKILRRSSPLYKVAQFWLSPVHIFPYPLNHL